MIYYFSGTGNSKWVAEQLASKTDEIAVNMVEVSVVPSMDNQSIGVVFPIYAWGEKCYQCTSCINRCPTKAIEYGKATSARGRYQFKEY